MTATTATLSPSIASRGMSSLLRIATAVVLLAVLVVGSFALGRSMADTGDDAPAVVRTAPAASPAPASCGHTVHTPPC